MITLNAARCKKCGDTIASEHRHDFKWCKCKAIAVDGGHDYIRRVGDLDSIEELSKYEPGQVVTNFELLGES